MRLPLKGWLLTLLCVPFNVLAVPVESLDGVNSAGAEVPVFDDALAAGFDPAELQLLDGLSSLWSYLVSFPHSVERPSRELPLLVAQAGESDIGGVFPQSHPGFIPPAKPTEPDASSGEFAPLEFKAESDNPGKKPDRAATMLPRANSKHLWGQLFAGELFYSVDFSYLSTVALGESLWSTLEIGQGANNDWVDTDLDFTLSAADYGLDFTGWHGSEQVFVYLDSDRQGMGVCQHPLHDDLDLVDRPDPGTDAAVCGDSDVGVLGAGDSIRIRPNVDIWIRELGFLTPNLSDDAGGDRTVGLGGGIHTLASRSETDEQYRWRPAVPYFVAANTIFEITHIDAPVLVSELSFYRAVPPVPASVSFPVHNELPEPPVNGQASVDEPSGLMLLGMLALLIARRKRLGMSYKAISLIKLN